MITVIDLKTMKEIPPPRASVLCLGNFDGIHLGHRRLVTETIRQKETLSPLYDGLVSGAWFFRAPPSEILTGTPVPQIMTLQEKLEKFASLGLDCAYLADFGDIYTLSPEDFVQNILKQNCRCIFAVCGFNFHFAHRGTGNAEVLARLMDGKAHIVDCFTDEGEAVSSSRIRSLLQAGDVTAAARLLGDDFTLTAPVMHGKHLGRTLGIPTVNQFFPVGAILPKNGIYITKTHVRGAVYRSVSNIGIRPSVEHTDTVNCETHIIGFEGDVYGEILTVEFVARIRDEMTFSTLDELVAQIRKDIKTAKEYPLS